MARRSGLPSYKAGRLILMLGGLFFCITRGVSYMPMFSSPPYGFAVTLLSGGGFFIWFWATLWTVAAGLFLWDIFDGKSHRGLILTIGLMGAWGAGYLLAASIETLENGIISRNFLTAGTYMFPAMMIVGMLIKVSRLRIAAAAMARPVEGD